MTPDENKALVRRWFAAIDAGDRTTIEDLCAPDYIDHSPQLNDLPGGRDGVHVACETFWAAFTDVVHVIEEQIAKGDKVLTRVQAHGTFSDTLLGEPPTGEVITLGGIAVHRLADGKLVEHWALYDLRSLMRPLTDQPLAETTDSVPYIHDGSQHVDVVHTTPHSNGPQERL